MITTVLKYEIKNRFSHWSIFLLYGLLIFQGIWYTKGTFDQYVNEGLLMNAAAIFYKNLAGGGLLMIIIIAVITGPVLFKDIQYKTGQWLFTNPINEKKFFLSRFLAAFAINALVAFGYVIGMLLVPSSGIGEAHRFGAAPVGQLLHGYFFLLLPNLFLLTTLVFFALVYFRKMAAGYLAVIITVIAFLLMQANVGSSGATPLLLMGDPFGYVAVDNAIEFMTVKERNVGYLKFTNHLLANRLLWLGFSFVLFLLAYRKFSFKGFLKPSSTKIKKENEADVWVEKMHSSLQAAAVHKRFGLIDFIRKLFSLSLLEIKNVVRPSGFKVIIGLVVLMNILQNLLWNASFYIGPTEPLTFTMTAFRLSFGVFIMILIMVWSGELFFKDRTVNFWQISDALPVPVWTVTMSRFIAMMAVSFTFALAFMLTGIAVQIAKGGVSLIDFKLYAYDLLGYNWGWLSYVLQIALVFFIAGLTKNRIATHIISVGIFFITIMAFELNLAEQTIYAYAAVPGLEDYSEISGYGIWTLAGKWYFLMWTLLAVGFILSGIWFWQRGSSRKWWSSFSLKNKQLSLVGKLVLFIAFTGFVATRIFIIQQVNGKENFVFSKIEEKQEADYEKKYGYLKTVVQPKYQHIDLKFDFYPNERKAEYEASIILGNQTGKAIDTLYLNWENFIMVQQISIGKIPLQKIWTDEELKITAYGVPKQYRTDSLMEISIAATKQYTGFTQSGKTPQPDLMFNGSFGNIKQFLPTIGYHYERELKENRKRVDNGLIKLTSRMASIDDQTALHQDALAFDADWVTGTIEISTVEDQKVIAPGKMIKEWKTNGRNHYRFTLLKPQPFNWKIGTANYEIKKVEANGVDVQIYHDSKHTSNTSLYADATTKAIKFVQKNLGSFPAEQIRIYEVPYYQEAFYSFPNGIAISEKEGWYATTDALKEKAYIYQTVAAQVIRKWVYSNIKIANVQGADMLKEALPEALAIAFIEKELGKEGADIIVKKKNDKYAKDKNNEANQEPALLYADGAEYLERNKGAITLYKTIQVIGLSTFSKQLTLWTASSDNKKTFKSFIDFLHPQLTPETYMLYTNTD